MCDWGDLNAAEPGITISPPHLSSQPPTVGQMAAPLRKFGFPPPGSLRIGNKNSISLDQPTRRIAMFDAHPGTFFHTAGLTIPIDGILAEITADAEHEWLRQQVSR